VEPDLEFLDANTASGYLSVFSELAVPISLTATLPGAPAMTGDVSLMVTIGVEFYQQIGPIQYLLAQGNAMKIDSLH
jgi:hypothetical protein